MKYFKTLLLLGIVLILGSTVWADIPKQINFQGVLRDSVGNPYPNGNYTITFRIYNAASGGNIVWQEADVFAISGGLVTHLLGSITPIPDTVFKDSLRWLGVQVGGNPEITPRSQLVSVPYSYVADFAQNADLLDGANSSDFSLISHNHASQYAALVHSHSTFDIPALDSVYVNVTGPDSVVTTSGTAFYGRSAGSSGSNIIGVRGFGQNTGAGEAYGGRFEAPSAGTGSTYGVYGTATGFTASSTYGSYGTANNISSGNVYGGSFVASPSGTGAHYAIYGSAFGNSASQTSGIYCFADNTSSGNVYGAYFQTSANGTGTHYGVRGDATGSSANPTYGCLSQVSNSSSGNVYGGYYLASSGGTGTHYGVYGIETAGGSGAAVYASGDFVASGSKSAVLKTSQGERLFYTMESPEVWFEDFGEGRLVNGRAHIELDALFLETVTINALNPMKVFIQLNDPNSNGVAVVKGTTGFDVIELQNGTSNATFDYRILAKRKGYENQRLPQTTVGTDDPNLYPELWQEIEKRQEEARATPDLEN